MNFTKMGTDLRFLITFDKGTLVITLFSERNLKRIGYENIWKKRTLFNAILYGIKPDLRISDDVV